jgi:hypothetical protein
MRALKLVVVSLLLCGFGGAMVGATRGGAAAVRQWAVVTSGADLICTIARACHFHP